MKEARLRLTALPKTWVIDLDGVVLRHNAYLYGREEVLPGVWEFWDQVRPQDVVVVMTARMESERESTLRTLRLHGLRVDYALFGMPVGERVIINDIKPSGLVTAIAVNVPRDAGLGSLRVQIDEAL